ncbi:hypothetical protein Hypma_014719 [Hypsizygus marmoreus]|uniref:Uncharacterized protein n=1 Tax=Hypsizygus marmoreus TaxID=39966 RepID=A0A369JA20_HYPMA|nr:hypothetical protein Hypma_014719 [Hypsizygus marmoreus]
MPRTGGEALLVPRGRGVIQLPNAARTSVYIASRSQLKIMGFDLLMVQTTSTNLDDEKESEAFGGER